MEEVYFIFFRPTNYPVLWNWAFEKLRIILANPPSDVSRNVCGSQYGLGTYGDPDPQFRLLQKVEFLSYIDQTRIGN
jgi:hypothetical protein